MSEDDENLRLVFQLTHDRNERLISYIRVTDGAIWGFIGLVIIQFFNKGVVWDSPKIPIFFALLTVSMFLWRFRVAEYQKDVLKGHIRMLRCEKLLGVPFEVTIRKNYYKTMDNNSFVNPKPETFSELIDLLDSDKYKDPRHVEIHWIAYIIGTSGIIFFFIWVFSNLYRYIPIHWFIPILMVYLFLGSLVIWETLWRSKIVNIWSS